MVIKKLHIENFRSFKELDLELDDFNVVIGANASGKSNFIEIFRFLRDIARDGLENAVSLQGGAKYISNLSLPDTDLTKFEYLLSGSWISRRTVGDDSFLVLKDNLTSRLSFNVNRINNDGVRYVDDIIQYTAYIQKDGNIDMTSLINCIKENYLIKRDITIHKNQEGIISNMQPQDKLHEYEPDWIGEFTRYFDMTSIENKYDKLFLEVSPKLRITLEHEFPVYDFHPSITKRSAPRLGRVDLEEDGSNLSITLDKILGDKDEKRKYLDYLNYLLPNIEDVKVERDFDGAYITKVKESYFEEYLPSYMLSDGTISILTLIAALFFGDRKFVIFEEPEKHIHPNLISDLMELIKEASEDTQIIVTTHSPELLKHTPMANMLFVRRNVEGFSEIIKPDESETVKTFLENDIGIDELFVQNFIDF